MVDRLVTEFPRFNDVSQYNGHEIKFYKLPQLGIWMLYGICTSLMAFRSKTFLQ